MPVTRSRSKSNLVDKDIEIGSRIWLRNQRKISMENDELKRKIESLEETLLNMIKEFAELKATQNVNARKELDLRESSHQAQKLPLKLEVKFDLKSFEGEIDVEKLN